MNAAEAGPIFVGGTGRSGTSILAKLLGSHPQLVRVPIEVRFLADRNGLCDLVDGRTNKEQFRRAVLGQWWHRTTARGETRGLHKIVERSELEAAVTDLMALIDRDPLAAAAQFTGRLLDPIASRAHALRWVEDTPPNITVASTLLRIVPTARLIHMVRDGRDVACSVVKLTWGPKTLSEALEWWAQTLLSAHRASAAVGGARLLTVRFEDLVRDDRENTYRRLLTFLDLADETPMRKFFTNSVSGDRAHTGRWQREVPADAQPGFLELYDRLLHDLTSAGAGPVPGSQR